MDIASTIRAAAARYGLDPETMVRIAQTESSLNPNAANPQSSARGVYQFIAPTWRQYGGAADPRDPAANIDAGMRLARDNVATLRNGLGRDPTPGEIYLAHQQGAGGALAMLKNPSAPVGGDAIALNGGTPGMTAGDFAQKWVGRFDGTASAPSAGPPTASAPNLNVQTATTQPGIDLSPLAEAMQRVAMAPEGRQKRRGGPLVLS